MLCLQLVSRLDTEVFQHKKWIQVNKCFLKYFPKYFQGQKDSCLHSNAYKGRFRQGRKNVFKAKLFLFLCIYPREMKIYIYTKTCR